MQHSPALQRAMANIQAAHGRALQVGLTPNPQVGIDYQQIASRGLAEQFGATLQQEFVVREKLQLNREVAFQDIERLEHQLAIERQRVLTDVRIAFVRTLKAQKQLEFLQKLVAISDQVRVISEKLFEAEEVGKTDVLQAEVEVQRAKVAHLKALNRRRAAWRELAAVLGQPDLPWQSLAGDLKGPTGKRDFAEDAVATAVHQPRTGSAGRHRFNAPAVIYAGSKSSPDPTSPFKDLSTGRTTASGGWRMEHLPSRCRFPSGTGIRGPSRPPIRN